MDKSDEHIKNPDGDDGSDKIELPLTGLWLSAPGKQR